MNNKIQPDTEQVHPRITHQGAISLIFLALALFWFFIFFKYSNIQRVSLFSTESVDFSNEWYYIKNSDHVYVHLPDSVPLDKDGVARIYFDVPQAQIPEFNIAFFTKNQSDTVSIGSYVLESYIGTNYPSWLSVTGASYHIVSIPQNSDTKNQTVCIALKSSWSKYDGFFPEIRRGSRSSLLMYLVQRSLARIITSFLIFILGIILLGIAFVFRKQMNGDHTLRALGYLSILVGCWLLEETNFTQLLYSNPLVHWLFDYFFFITMPITFFYFIEELSGIHNDKGLGILTYVDIAIIILSLVLQVGWKVILPKTLLFTHLFLIISLLYVVFFFVREIKQGNTRMRNYLPAILILVVGAFIEIGNYYIRVYVQLIGQNVALTFSFLVFFVYLGVQVYRTSVYKIQELADATTYHKLAFIDFSTGVYNRTAYYTFVEKFDEKISQPYCIILFDMNNLKKINDTYGHLYGDRVIKTFSDCAQRAFGIYGKVYRIGGDEFLALIRNPVFEQVQEACSRFERNVTNQQEVQYKFTVAYGLTLFSAKIGDDFFAAQKAADANMYKMKTLMKKEHKMETFQKVTDIEEEGK